MQNEGTMPAKLNGRLMTNAIRRLGGSSGLTMVQIKKYLQNDKKLDCDAGGIKAYLKNAVQSGKLSLQDRKYKVNETARQRRRSSGGSPKRRRRSGSRRSSKPSGSKKGRPFGSRRHRRSKKAAAE